MIVQPLLWGVGLGTAAAALLVLTGMIREGAGAAVALVAISAIWIVFSVADDGTDPLLHGAVFAAFTAAAVYGYLRQLRIIAHGGFDAAMLVRTAPGPAWWPMFCAAIDAVTGTTWLVLGQRKTSP